LDGGAIDPNAEEFIGGWEKNPDLADEEQVRKSACWMFNPSQELVDEWKERRCCARCGRKCDCPIATETIND
jgi:hypothetical protein